MGEFNSDDHYIYYRGQESLRRNGVAISSVQFSRSVMSDSLQPHELQHARPPCPSPSPGVHSDSMFIESVMPSSHLILCHPLLLLPPILPSIRVFSNESTLRVRWPKYWSFSFSVSPSKERGLPFPSPVDLILSDLSTMTRRSWVAPHGMA